MTDVFISYARADRAAAEAIATAIARCGWNVWWDRRIAVGRSFSEAIEQELESARCVVVLWSRASVASEWVANEAAEGARRRILVPIRIEDVTPPLEFRRLQTATLLDRQRIEANPEFADCIAAIRGLVGQPLQNPSASAGPTVADLVSDAPRAMPETVNDGARPWFLKAPSIGAALLVAVLAFGLTRWKEKTPEEPSLDTIAGETAGDQSIGTVQTASAPATATEPAPTSTTTTGATRGVTRVPSRKLVVSSATTPSLARLDLDREASANFEDAEYPEVARKARIQGTVIASVRLAADGSVQGVDILKPLPFGLDSAAKGAILRSKFKPAVRNGKAVESSIPVTYTFDPTLGRGTPSQ